MRHLEPLQGVLEAFLRRALRDPNSIADVLQSAIAVAFRNFDRYAEGTNFRAWIFRIVHLEVLNRNRKDRRTRREPLTEEIAVRSDWDEAIDDTVFRQLLHDPDPVLQRCDEALSRAVADLPPGDRDVFLLRAIGEFKYREIADILQMPLGTVMSNLSRSRARLRKELVAYGRAANLLSREEH